MLAVMGLNLPPIEDLDVDDLLTLPEGYRYELHEGYLVIMTPSSFWHKEMSARLLFMLRAAGLKAVQDPGVRGDRPRDNRLPDVGVVDVMPPKPASVSNLPGSAYRLIAEVVSEKSLNGEFTDIMAWYAERGIPEYWVLEQTPERVEDDALVHIHMLSSSDSKRAYVLERRLLLSELELEYQAGA
jgi:Uma2 family endonuclease